LGGEGVDTRDGRDRFGLSRLPSVAPVPHGCGPVTGTLHNNGLVLAIASTGDLTRGVRINFKLAN